MPLILALLFGSEFGAGSRGDDPRHQRRRDHLRADARPDPRPGRRRVPVHQLRRPPDRRAARRAARDGARRPRGDLGQRRSPAMAGVLFLVGSPVLRLRELPGGRRESTAGVRAGVTPSGTSGAARTTAPTPQTARIASGSGDRDVARPERQPERVGQGRRRQEPGDASPSGPGRCDDRQDDPAEQQERDEQPVGQGEGRLGTQRAGHQQPEPGERERPEQQRRRRGAPARRRARVASRGRARRSRRAGRPGRPRRRGPRSSWRASRPARVSGEPPSRLRTP